MGVGDGPAYFFRVCGEAPISGGSRLGQKSENMVAKAINETEELPEPAEEIVEEPAAVEPGAPVPGKRQLGVKEPIVFKWKILGESEGVILTLFKGVEREEVDAQLDRLQKEGYYKNLRAVDINEKVVQPKPPAPPTPVSARKPAVKKKPPAEKKAKESPKTKPAAKEKPKAKAAEAKPAKKKAVAPKKKKR
jgi:hypothetical protein